MLAVPSSVVLFQFIPFGICGVLASVVFWQLWCFGNWWCVGRGDDLHTDTYLPCCVGDQQKAVTLEL